VALTLAEKILARASGRAALVAGEYVTARGDKTMCPEAFVLCALQLAKLGARRLFDPEREQARETLHLLGVAGVVAESLRLEVLRRRLAAQPAGRAG
jgi:hypothetical protein